MKNVYRIIVRSVLFMFLFLVSGMGWNMGKAEASSCSIQFSAPKTEIPRGDIFTVICRISSADVFTDASFTIDYDDSIMQFIKGGKNISGGYGELQVASTDNEEEVNRRTFSLQFMAKGKGSGLVRVKGAAEVTDASGECFSVSSNSLSLEVKKEGFESSREETDSPDDLTEPDEPAETDGAEETHEPEREALPVNTTVPGEGAADTASPEEIKPSAILAEVSKNKPAADRTMDKEKISHYATVGIVIVFLVMLAGIAVILKRKH